MVKKLSIAKLENDTIEFKGEGVEIEEEVEECIKEWKEKDPWPKIFRRSEMNRTKKCEGGRILG